MKDSRLELRVEPELKARVVAEAGRRGQKVATFVERALEEALGKARANLPDGGESKAEGRGGSPASSRAVDPGTVQVQRSVTLPKLSGRVQGHRPTCSCAMCKPVKG